MTKFFTACAIFGAAYAFALHDFWWTSTAGACIAGLIGGWGLREIYNRKRILPHHDPNIPFTSEELREIGIILPDAGRYDCETFIR